MTPRLLAEEADWLWLYKPAGLPVFPLHADGSAPCLLAWLLEERPEQKFSFPQGFEGGIAHRLDNPTSGVVLAARSTQALAVAREAFSSGALRKTYRLISHKSVPWRENHVTTPIAHHPDRRDRMVVQRGASTPHRGKWYPADTHFRQLEGPLWEAVILSGVTHQIRVHAASVGLALAGDKLYGGGPPLDGAPAPFALHHVGLSGLSEGAPRCEPPPWWGRFSAPGA